MALTGVVTGSVAKIELDVSFSPPVIDIAPLVHPDAFSASDTARVRLEILQASNRWGFFQVINHGIQESMQNELVHQMKLFFGSPQDTKYTVRRTEDNSRGFADDELTKRLKDVKEIFDVGQVPYTDLTPEALRNQIVDGYNQWPSAEYAHLQQFKPTVDAYYDACLALSRTLVKAMAAVIPCANETYFENAFDRHSSFLRLNYYPTLTDGVDAGAQPVQRTHGAEDTDNSAKNNDNDAIESTSGSDSESTGLPPRLGVSRHTDAGALTVLWQDLNPAVTRGLEVRELRFGIQCMDVNTLCHTWRFTTRESPVCTQRSTLVRVCFPDHLYLSCVYIYIHNIRPQVYSGSKEDAGDGVWVPVTPVPGSLTINTGDMLQVMH